jgi:hypothetical protein
LQALRGAAQAQIPDAHEVPFMQTPPVQQASPGAPHAPPDPASLPASTLPPVPLALEPLEPPPLPAGANSRWVGVQAVDAPQTVHNVASTTALETPLEEPGTARATNALPRHG